MSVIKIIVAMDHSRLIGKQNGHAGMPWYNKEDLNHFKQTTLHHTLLMGRKTFEAIGRPLPDRQTIVITNNKDLNLEGVTLCHDLTSIIQNYQGQSKDLYICGGASIYKQVLPYVDEILISLIPGDHEGEVYFPPLPENQFECKEEIMMNTFKLQRYIRRNL